MSAALPEGDLTGLREAEATYRWLFVGNPAPMFIYRRGSLELLAFNDAFLALYGYTEKQALRLRLTDLYLPADRDTVVQRVAGFRGAVNAGQWRHVRRDGSLLWVLDRDKNVEVYKGDGTQLGQWKAYGLGTEPEGITLDGKDLWMADRAGKLYWQEPNQIKRANLDGSGVETLVDLARPLTSMTLDPARGRLYWATAATPAPGQAGRPPAGRRSAAARPTDGRPRL